MVAAVQHADDSHFCGRAAGERAPGPALVRSMRRKVVDAPCTAVPRAASQLHVRDRMLSKGPWDLRVRQRRRGVDLHMPVVLYCSSFSCFLSVSSSTDHACFEVPGRTFRNIRPRGATSRDECKHTLPREGSVPDHRWRHGPNHLSCGQESDQ